MKVLVDMNLSPAWCALLARHGWEAVHWVDVGNPRAPDREIMRWAREQGFVVFTHDLDFSVLLATTRAAGPSVVQVRARDVTPEHMGSTLARVLQAHQDTLEQGAIVTVDEQQARVRILPL